MEHLSFEDDYAHNLEEFSSESNIIPSPPDIQIGDSIYRFYTNDILEPQINNPNESEYTRNFHEFVRAASRNRHKLFIELTRRGFGIIPEKPVKGLLSGQEIPANFFSNFYSYYEDIDSGALTEDLTDAVDAQLPTSNNPFFYHGLSDQIEDLTEAFISELVDTVLSEKEFEAAKMFSQAYKQKQVILQRIGHTSRTAHQESSPDFI